MTADPLITEAPGVQTALLRPLDADTLAHLERVFTDEACQMLAREAEQYCFTPGEYVPQLARLLLNSRAALVVERQARQDAEKALADLRGEVRRFIASEYPAGTFHPADVAADDLARAAAGSGDTETTP